MSNATTEQKMRLIQQIRSRYREDRYDMYNREQILYGKSAWPGNRRLSYDPESPDPESDPYGPEYPQHVSGFRLRLILSLLLFAALIAMDRNGIAIGGITAEKVMEVISVDYEEKIDAWVETLSRSGE
ncbi:MAG: hypothetical protein NC541_07160 [bacterium]|nr:hypothetical protein [bacterium]